MFDNLFRKFSFSPSPSHFYESTPEPLPPTENKNEDVEKLYYWYNTYRDAKERGGDNLGPLQAVLGLCYEECFDLSIVRKKYESWKSELNVEKYPLAQQRERAQYLMSKINVEYQMLLNRYKRFHQIPSLMEGVLAFKPKVKTLWRRASKELDDTKDEMIFEDTEAIVSLWIKILETEDTVINLRGEFVENVSYIKETLKIKEENECGLSDREVKYITFINKLLEKIDEAQIMNNEAKDLFKKREENAMDKYTQFSKAIVEKTNTYKNTGTILGKIVYMKDSQRFSSIQNITSKLQTLASDTRTILEQYNELRSSLKKERDFTYQKHIEGDVFRSFLRRRGILNSCLVDIYDKLLITYPELDHSDYSLYTSSMFDSL